MWKSHVKRHLIATIISGEEAIFRCQRLFALKLYESYHAERMDKSETYCDGVANKFPLFFACG